jgi:hypothetical protein
MTDRQLDTIWALMSRGDHYIAPDDRKVILATIKTAKQASDMIAALLAGTVPKCIACLRIKPVDQDSICDDCQPVNQDTRAALIALLTPTKEGSTSGEPIHA